MNSKTIAWLLVATLLSGLSGCKKKRAEKNKQEVAVTTVDSTQIDATVVDLALFDEKANNFKIQEVDFDYLTTKSKFSFKNKREDLDNANINLRVKKDSLIWFSVTALGFEVARGLISPREITVLDKFHKDYYTYDYAELSRRFQFDLSYPLLQSLIVGDLPAPRRANQPLYRKDGAILLRQLSDRLTLDNYFGESSGKLEHVLATQPFSQNTLKLDYADLKNLNGYLFPYATSIRLDSRPAPDQPFEPTEIEIKHSRVEVMNNNPGFPFAIPASYERR